MAEIHQIHLQKAPPKMGDRILNKPKTSIMFWGRSKWSEKL